MEYFTEGKEIYCDLKIPLFYNDTENFEDNFEENDRLSLTFIEKGCGKILCKGTEILFAAPVILCLNETEIPKPINVYDFSATSIYFTPSIVNEKFDFNNIKEIHNDFSLTEMQDRYLLLPFIQHTVVDNCIMGITSETVGAIAKLFHALNNALIVQGDYFWPCRCRSLLLELLVVVSKFFETNKDNCNEEALKLKEYNYSVIKYLQVNYQKKITLNELAKLFNTNRTTLNDQFYLETKQTIIEYLIEYRVNLAAVMLRDTMVPIAEIMERVGFNNPTHFWRMFKKQIGFSPSQYRNKYCWVK